MREIKFRGKCNKQWQGSNMSGKWVYGGLGFTKNVPVIINSDLQNHYFVDPESVGQFLEITGL